MLYHAGYQDLNGLDRHVEQTIDALRTRRANGTIQAIVCQGVSGMAVAIPAALALDLPILVLRKDGESTHSSGSQLIGHKFARGSRVVFVDDFIDAGYTWQRCRRAVEEAGGTMTGAYLYRDNEYAPTNLINRERFRFYQEPQTPEQVREAVERLS